MNNLTSEKPNTELSVIKQTIRRQNEQGEQLVAIVEYMEVMKQEMTLLYEDMKYELEEFKKTVPLSPGEEEKIAELTKKKAVEFTRYLFAGRYVSSELFGLKLTHINQGIYTALKRAFNHTGTYRTMLHTTFDDAFEYLENLTIHHLPPYYLEFTEKQQEVAVRTGVDLSGLVLRGGKK